MEELIDLVEQVQTRTFEWFLLFAEFPVKNSNTQMNNRKQTKLRQQQSSLEAKTKTAKQLKHKSQIRTNFIQISFYRKPLMSTTARFALVMFRNVFFKYKVKFIEAALKS